MDDTLFSGGAAPGPETAPRRHHSGRCRWSGKTAGGKSTGCSTLSGNRNRRVDKFYDVIGRLVPFPKFVVICGCGERTRYSKNAYVAAYAGIENIRGRDETQERRIGYVHADAPVGDPGFESRTAHQPFSIGCPTVPLLCKTWFQILVREFAGAAGADRLDVSNNPSLVNVLESFSGASWDAEGTFAIGIPGMATITRTDIFGSERCWGSRSPVVAGGGVESVSLSATPGAPVPEPGTLALGGPGIAVAAFVRRRFR